jgi:hypothetical protein
MHDFYLLFLTLTTSATPRIKLDWYGERMSGLCKAIVCLWFLWSLGVVTMMGFYYGALAIMVILAIGEWYVLVLVRRCSVVSLLHD